jgi:hypothetical protein
MKEIQSQIPPTITAIYLIGNFSLQALNWFWYVLRFDPELVLNVPFCRFYKMIVALRKRVVTKSDPANGLASVKKHE